MQYFIQTNCLNCVLEKHIITMQDKKLLLFLFFLVLAFNVQSVSQTTSLKEIIFLVIWYSPSYYVML